MTAYDFSRIEKEAEEKGKGWHAELTATYGAVFEKLSQMLPGFLIVPEVDGGLVVERKSKYKPGAEAKALTYDPESKSVTISVVPPGTDGTWFMSIVTRVQPDGVVLTCGAHSLAIPLGVWSSPDAHAKEAWVEGIERSLTAGLRDLTTLIQSQAAEASCMRPFLDNALFLRKVLKQ